MCDKWRYKQTDLAKCRCTLLCSNVRVHFKIWLSGEELKRSLTLYQTTKLYTTNFKGLADYKM